MDFSLKKSKDVEIKYLLLRKERKEYFLVILFAVILCYHEVSDDFIHSGADADHGDEMKTMMLVMMIMMLMMMMVLVMMMLVCLIWRVLALSVTNTGLGIEICVQCTMYIVSLILCT